jgi:hypothetical protein
MPVAKTACSSNGNALQLTSGLDFLSIQAYRLWMEYPSRDLDESKLEDIDGYVGSTGSGIMHALLRSRAISADRLPPLSEFGTGRV